MSETKQRSLFVTVVAWVSIVMTGLATTFFLLQNIMLFTLIGGRDFAHMGQASHHGMGGLSGFMLSHAQWVFLAYLIVSVLAFASSIGLLQRRAWARWSFIGLLGLGIAWNLMSVVVQVGVIGSLRENLHGPTVPGAPDMRSFFMLMTALSVVVAAACCVLFGWLARRLLSPEIAAEFQG